MTTLEVVPGIYEQASTERVPIEIDMAPLLGVGESVASPTATLTRLSNGTEYAEGIEGNPTEAGDVVTLTLANLEPGERYRLVVLFTAALGKELAPSLIVKCPY